MSNAREAVINTIKDFKAHHGRPPTRVFVDAELEADLAMLAAGDVGDLAGKIVVGGPREAFRDGLLGLEIVWDADSFRVE